MAFVVSSLPAYVQENRDLLVKNFALVGTSTRQRISIQTGIKKDAYLNFLNLEPVLQDGSGCGFSASGNGTLSQKTIATAAIKVNMEFCADTLRGKYAEYLVRVGATQNDLPFERYIIDGLVAELNKKIETLIWQGDHTQTTDPNVKWIDGFIYQFDNDAAVVDVALAHGTAIWNAVYAVYSGMSEVALDRDPEIYVSPANYRAFILALMEKNLFHFSAPQEAYPDEIFIPGTNAKLVKTPGLAGVDDKIVGTFPANLVYGCDVEGDAETIKVVYEDKTEMFDVIARWNSGVAYHFGEHVTLGTIAAS